MGAKKAKLDEQFAEDALKNPYKESDLFNGISIFVNGLTNPSADELKRIMMKNGGVFHTYQRQSTTFIIATNLPDVKVRQITSAKIISPQWVVDCLHEKRILDYSKYLLYTNCKVSQPKITFAKKEHDNKSISINNNCIINESISKKSIMSPATESKFILNNLNIFNTAIRDDDEFVEHKNILSKSLETSAQIKNEIRKGTALTAVDPDFLSEFYNNSRLHHIATLGASFKSHISKLRERHNGAFPSRETLKQLLAASRTEEIIFLPTGNAIMHIDMDCFFVSVGLRTRPHLKGLAIAVTHSKGSNANNLKRGIGVDRHKEVELYVKRHDEKYKVDGMLLDKDEKDKRMRKLAAIENATSLSEIASCSYEARKMGVRNGMFVGAALKLCPNLKTIPYDFDAYKEVANTLYDTITQYSYISFSI